MLNSNKFQKALGFVLLNMKIRAEDSDRSKDKSPTERTASERVSVHVRLRPYTEDEYIKDRQSCIESFDVEGKAVVGIETCSNVGISNLY